MKPIIPCALCWLAAFTVPSLPATEPRFVALDAAATGVTAPNAYPDLLGRFEDIMRGALGSGVALADLDGDGRPDVVTVSKFEGLHLFTNLGGWKFRDDTAVAGLAPERLGTDAAPIWYQGVSAADVNGDGLLDLYVCRIGAPNQLFMNLGGGRFRDEAAARGVAITDGSNMAAFADYDHDGWLDFCLQTNIWRADHPEGEPDRLFRNTGDGHFVETTATSGFAGPTQGHGLVWCDFDDDGWPDLYLGNDFEGPDRLYRNNHDGTFTDVIGDVMPSISNSSMGVDSADVDNDGRVDFFVADMAATTPEKDLRGMVNRRLGGTEPLENPEALRQYPANTLLLNTGTGRFLEAAHLAGLARSDWTWSVLFGDFDQDGRVDLHLTNGVFRELHNIDLSSRSYLATSRAEQLAILKRCPIYNEANLFFRNAGDVHFDECAGAVGLADNGVSFGAATGDLDGDGDLDLVYIQFRRDPAVFRNDWASGRSIILDLRSDTPNRFGIGAKVTLRTRSGVQVRELQQARGYLSTSEPIVHFGLAAGDDSAEAEIRWPSGRVQRVGDLRAGSRQTVHEDLSLAPGAPTAPAPTRWREVAQPAGMAVRAREAATNEQVRQPLAPEVFNRAGPALIAADFNGDGADDYVMGATTRDTGTLFLSNGRGGFARTTFDDGAALNRGPMVAADFSRTGHLELLVSSGGTTAPLGDAAYRLQLWRLGAAGRLEPGDRVLPDFSGPVGALAVADFDHDGWLDVVVAGRVVPGRFPESAPIAFWRGGRAGWMADAAMLPAGAGGMVTSALATDVDGDGWTDLLLAREWATLQYLHNDGGKGFSDWSERAGLTALGVGLWSSLAAADLDGDGHMDYVAGNVGRNTTLAAMPGETAVLYWGRFFGQETSQPVEAVVHGGREWPRRGLAVLGTVFRDLPRRFAANDRYAAAGLAGIFALAELARAERRELQQKDSGVLRQGADGRFHFTPLPWLAQLAPLRGMLLIDADGDGKLDLVAAQNSYDALPEHGRADAGLGVFLRGDGRGGFTAVAPSASGWVLPGDARGLVAADFDRDGSPDFLVTRNNRESALFLQQLPADATRWRISLAAEPGGGGFPWGARLTAVYADGLRQGVEFAPVTAELSQSAPVAFVASPASNPLRTIEVRWPSGQVSRHPPPAPGRDTIYLRREP